METIQVDTNIHCEQCVDKLTPHLNEANEITKWEFDLSLPIKILKVKGEGISVDRVSTLLGKEGYSIIQQVDKPAKSFWSNRIKWKRASFNIWYVIHFYGWYGGGHEYHRFPYHRW